MEALQIGRRGPHALQHVGEELKTENGPAQIRLLSMAGQTVPVTEVKHRTATFTIAQVRKSM